MTEWSRGSWDKKKKIAHHYSKCGSLQLYLKVALEINFYQSSYLPSEFYLKILAALEKFNSFEADIVLEKSKLRHSNW